MVISHRILLRMRSISDKSCRENQNTHLYVQYQPPPPPPRKKCNLRDNMEKYDKTGGTAVAQWLRFCATNRNVASSIPVGVIGIFH